MAYEIEEASLSEALNLLGQLPEFDQLRPLDYYEQMLKSKAQLILVAKHNRKTVGCKLGYDRFEDGSFYSWLGGVLPAHRKSGVAWKLARHQEEWARKTGFGSIKFKTQNRHKAMLQFAIKNGFSIYNVKSKDELELYRIELIKKL
ncbi:MAG: GNAT family N-acetyltransferase [Roseivirga sp.]|nr:GNAT family N-acetyltransferase [Roseivirga sp.]